MLLKFVIRNLIKRPFLNLIKVVGLSLALSGILFITLFLKNELFYDSYHQNSERIFRYTYTSPDYFEGNHFARVYNSTYIPDLCDHFPEIENFVRLVPIWGGIKYDRNYITVKQAFACDSTFFDFFDAELLVGDRDIILKSPGTLVVTESLAKRVFGAANPIGQVLNLSVAQYDTKNSDFTVQAIMKDFPQNSHFHPEILISAVDNDIFEDWAFTYLLLSKHANPDNIISGAKDFFAEREGKKKEEIKTEAHLEKLTDIHIHSDKLREIEVNNNSSNIFMLAIAAIILLLISLSNYANLNIGMAGYYSKFFYVNKILGSLNRFNLKYFIIEGLMITLLSLTITILLLVPFNSIIQKYYSLDLITGNIAIILAVIILFSMLIIITGILPVLSRVISDIRLKLIHGSKMILNRNRMSKGLIVLQYSFSIVLIVAIITITKQLNFVLRNSMGNTSGNTICIDSAQGKFQVFKEELQKHSSIEMVSAMFTEFGGESNDMFHFKMEGYQKTNQDGKLNKIGVFPCDYSFPAFFDLKFLSGNNFSKTCEDNEGSGEYIINEAAMKRLQYTNPNEIVGKYFQIVSNHPEVKIPTGKIIGVVEDFYLSSMKKKVVPLVMFKRKETWLFSNVVTFKTGMQKEGIAHVKEVWEKLYPAHPFQYEYVGSMYNKIYKTELLQAKLLSIFTFISLFICSIGLLGLIHLITQTRIKEIGVRKVNGATVMDILTMLNKYIFIWVSFAFIIACPIAYYAMNKWLENFAYKTALSWWIFALAGLAAMFIALITVSVQSWQAASRNPVEALRYE